MPIYTNIVQPRALGVNWSLSLPESNSGVRSLKARYALFSSKNGRFLFTVMMATVLAGLLLYFPRPTFGEGLSQALITIRWSPAECGANGCGGYGNGQMLERTDFHEPLSFQEETEIFRQRQAENKLTADRYGGPLLSRENKNRIAMQMQQVIEEHQKKYSDFMRRHRYQRPVSGALTKDIVLHPAPISVPHTLACRAHEPGLVAVPHSSVRGYCFGGTTLPGPRVCDSKITNYKSAPGGTKQVKKILYGKQFAVSPFYHVSNFTRRMRANSAAQKDSITICTQGSWNRMGHVTKLAKLWRGPISFALLLDNRSQTKELDQILSMTPELAEYVDLHVVWRNGHTANSAGAFYPINMLRNVGVQLVETGLLFALDVDNIPNAPHSQYQTWALEAEQAVADRSKQSTCPGLDAFIPPAIEMGSANLNRLYQSSKSSDTLRKTAVVDALQDGSAVPMHLYFGPAYLPTNHYTWSFSDTVDRVPYLARFEPYYIARAPIPLFNETFINRGGNFAQQVQEMYAGGYSFWRLPQAFVVDIPHTKGNASEDVSTTTAAGGGKIGSIEENSTQQAVHDQHFTSKVWQAFYSYLPHKYRFHLPSPMVNDPNFRRYRRAQERVANAMWYMLGTQEAMRQA